MNKYWKDRGYPWEYDPGPPKNRSWARLFAETPNYRGLGKAVIGREKFRWHFGPMFYRGRLWDNEVKVLVVGQEGAQDESLAHRAFTGGTGARMQYFLNYIGITRSYLFVNTFVYPIFGQYSGGKLKWLAQDPVSPIVVHRHELFNYILERNDVQLIIAVGNAAKESIVTWVEARGGSCAQGALDVSTCTGSHLDPHTRIVGVMHPGAAGQGGSVGTIKASFILALSKIKAWMDADPGWLLPDEDGSRHFDETYKYKGAPIPFRDFAFGTPLRLGRGGTSSNRKDRQRSIQIFSAAGKYNNQGASVQYSDLAFGDQQGYTQSVGEVPYEPPKGEYLDYDKGPGDDFARLLMGGEPGLAWPDFNALGANAHLSFGNGPIYRGRLEGAYVLILADQGSHDDLFTGRAMTGDSGQRLQAFLAAIGITEHYAILRSLPVDTLDLSPNIVNQIVTNPQCVAVHQAVVNAIHAASPDLGLVLTFGPHAEVLAQNLNLAGLPLVSLRAWVQPGSLQDWQNKLPIIQGVAYQRDLANPMFSYNGQRTQIPRLDLPYGTLRWIGSSGDRARQAIDKSTQAPSPNYYKLFIPDWVYDLDPEPLSAQEQVAIQSAP